MNPFSFFKNFRARPVTRLGISLIVLAATALHAQAATQTLKLKKGWNLVTVQVQPDDPSPTAVFGGTVGAAVKSVWEFDNRAADAGGKKWKTFRFPNTGENRIQNQLKGVTLGQVDFGDSFWIEVDRDRDLPINGEVPMVAPPVLLYPGWNLVGISAGQQFSGDLEQEKIPILNLLSKRKLNIDQFLKWQSGPDSEDSDENPGYRKNEFASEKGSDFNLFSPNQGYWFYLKEKAGENYPVIIQPKLETLVRGDLNLSPERFGGPEDLLISGAAEPVGSREMRKIIVFKNEDEATLSVINRGSGLLTWSANTTSSFLKLSLNPVTPQNDQVSSDVEGYVSSGRSTLYISVDRKGLSPGLHQGQVTLSSSGGGAEPSRSFEVVVHVPELTGDWVGDMSIQTVNGKSNQVPSPDLKLSIFSDDASAGSLRGVITSAGSAFWPTDVYLFGYSNGTKDQSFVLTGSYYLPPGDRNLPPFNHFDPLKDGEIDWNGDNVLDQINPYPFPLMRSISLQGSLIESSSLKGVVISGNYLETVEGLLQEPIKVEGQFKIFRESQGSVNLCL